MPTRIALRPQTWRKLAAAGLGNITKVILYQYHAFGEIVRTVVDRGLAEENRRPKRLQYADRVAKGKYGEHRAAMFAERLCAAQETAGKAPWPFQNANVKTLADASAAYTLIGNLPLAEAPAVIGTSRQNLDRASGKSMLAALQSGAKAHGVRLSLRELVELAEAAHNSLPTLDKNTLQRFLASESQRLAEPYYRQWFEELLHQMHEPEKPL